jgi:hypothetical protein
MTDKIISGSRLIPARASEIFAVLSDASQHSSFDGSDTVQDARSDGRVPLALGTKFAMNMKVSFLPYKITNEVVEFDKDRQIGWRHFGGHIWRYELEPADGGTLVTESFDYADALLPRIYQWFGYIESHPESIRATLERLEGLFTN